ncbi:MAG: patatin-like phospholipase family protein, partial [Flavobacteriales bacterium]
MPLLTPVVSFTPAVPGNIYFYSFVKLFCLIIIIDRMSFLHSTRFAFTGLLFAAIAAVECSGQSVGLVLSGGGASGLAHIGVIKALEENGIPIDYIAGNSIGALVGGMYAAGYSPEEIAAMFKSDEFKNISRGKLEDKYVYYFKQKEDDPSWITLKFDKDTVLQTSLPTNLISPVALDFMIMEKFSAPAALAGYDFDSLFVPFRCVASNIEDKELVIFRKGHLSQAVRASMSYPFYLKPIRVDGKLLFDGGLYNNFPSDIMYKDFFPDVILGSNVTGNIDPPDEDNLLSQIKNMLMNKTNYSVLCESGVC